MNRYHVVKKRVNMFDMFSMKRYVVRCADGTRNLFVGSKWNCHRIAHELNAAFNSGVFMADMEQKQQALEAKRCYPDSASGYRIIDWNVISELGLLRRINNEIMHPLGYAVFRTADCGVSGGALVSPDGKWEYQETNN